VGVVAEKLCRFPDQSARLDKRAAGFVGFREKRLIWLALLISGGLAGLAGVCEVTGPIGQLVPQVSPGYGYAAITVAFLGRLNPVGILFSSLLMALLYIGGESAQMSLNLPQAITQLFQGMMLFFLLASDVLILYRPRLNLRWTRRAPPPPYRRSAVMDIDLLSNIFYAMVRCGTLAAGGAG
jgi:simple sugar transport system permease protein